MWSTYYHKKQERTQEVSLLSLGARNTQSLFVDCTPIIFITNPLFFLFFQTLSLKSYYCCSCQTVLGFETLFYERMAAAAMKFPCPTPRLVYCVLFTNEIQEN